jgi:hypothetical protein
MELRTGLQSIFWMGWLLGRALTLDQSIFGRSISALLNLHDADLFSGAGTGESSLRRSCVAIALARYSQHG